MVQDAQHDAPTLCNRQVSGIAARVPARAEDVELCIGLPRTLGKDDVRQSAACDDDTLDSPHSGGWLLRMSIAGAYWGKARFWH